MTTTEEITALFNTALQEAAQAGHDLNSFGDGFGRGFAAATDKFCASTAELQQNNKHLLLGALNTTIATLQDAAQMIARS